MNTRAPQQQVKQKRKPRSLAEMMRVSLLIHKDGLLWIMHDKPLPGVLEWMEYDGDEGKLYLVSETGALLDLGFPLNKAFRTQLMKSKHLMTVHVADKKIHDMKIVPVVVRKWDMDELG
jgi:hypothetical protein